MGIVDNALKCLQQGHQSLALSPDSMRFGRDALPAQIRTALSGLSEGMTRAWEPPEEHEALSVVAVVGLLPAPARPLSSLLGALPGLAPRHGAPILTMTAQTLAETAPQLADDPARLAELSEGELSTLRARFRRIAQDAAGAGERLALLDASPLGLLRLPLLKRLWPEARVLIALRDPRDEVLASLFQRYRPGAMSVHLHQAATAATALTDLWRLWKRLRETLDLRFQEVRLEDLLAAPHREGRRIAQFLAQPWEDGAQRWADGLQESAVSEEQTPDVGPGRWRLYPALAASAAPPLKSVLADMGYPE
jgi:hypothetical protein